MLREALFMVISFIALAAGRKYQTPTVMGRSLGRSWRKVNLSVLLSVATSEMFCFSCLHVILSFYSAQIDLSSIHEYKDKTKVLNPSIFRELECKQLFSVSHICNIVTIVTTGIRNGVIIEFIYTIVVRTLFAKHLIDAVFLAFIEAGCTFWVVIGIKNLSPFCYHAISDLLTWLKFNCCAGSLGTMYCCLNNFLAIWQAICYLPIPWFLTYTCLAMHRGGCFEGIVRTRCPPSNNWGLDSELTKLHANRSTNSTNFPLMICLTTLARTWENLAPTTNGCSANMLTFDKGMRVPYFFKPCRRNETRGRLLFQDHLLLFYYSFRK